MTLIVYILIALLTAFYLSKRPSFDRTNRTDIITLILLALVWPIHWLLVLYVVVVKKTTTI